MIIALTARTKCNNTVSGLLVLVRSLGNNADQVEEVLGFVAKKTLEITNKSVHVSLASSFVNNVLVVIVSQSSGQLLIIHLWLIFTLTPPSGNLEQIKISFIQNF